MDLKKSDKIIAVIGVVILIVAAVAIVVFTAPEEGNGEPEEKEKPEFSVTWEQDTGCILLDDEYVSSEGYTKTMVVAVDQAGSVLTNVEMVLMWEDDYSKGLLLNKGLDIISAAIAPSGQECEPKDSVGSGNETFTFSSINEMPRDDIIEDVDSKSEALDLVDAEHEGENIATFDIDINWQKGEKLLTLRLGKLLNYFRDKGNSFTIEVNYDYFYPVIESLDSNSDHEDNEEADNTEDDYSWANIDRDVMLSSGRNWI